MAHGRVLVIDADNWVARLLADGLREHGFDVSVSMSGSEGLNALNLVAPDCVVLEMTLPEVDGAAVIRSIRAHAGAQSAVPLLVLTNADNMASRRTAFEAGADLYLTKPFRVDEVALQVRALVALRARLTHATQGRVATVPRRDSEPPDSATPGVSAIEGSISQMSIATVLTLLEMERRSGLLKISHNARTCILELVAGFAIGGSIDNSPIAPLGVLREILRWKEGRFRFVPGSDKAVPANRRSIGALLIEAVRLDDESVQARDSWISPEEMPTSRRSVVPSLPRSTPVGKRAAALSSVRKPPPPSAFSARPVPHGPVRRVVAPPPPPPPPAKTKR